MCSKINFKPGKTVPFCAPELASGFNKQNINNKVDVFAMAFMISELVFDDYPLDF